MLESPLIDKLIELALLEDLGLGDCTSTLCIPAQHRSEAKIIAREELVVCGLPLLARIVAAASWAGEQSPERPIIELRAQDGQLVPADVTVATLQGNTRTLLALERTLLNFLQRMSGVASAARDFVQKAGKVIVLDTRKTMPGWRMLDKYSCWVGGVRNHRATLGDMVLVKNNHIDAHGGRTVAENLRAALSSVRAAKGFYVPVEVEVRSLEELRVALEFSPEAVMLDNMSDAQMREAVAVVRAAARPPLVEASGGVTQSRLAALAEIGVDAVSVGGLTTRAPNKDISMRIERS